MERSIDYVAMAPFIYIYIYIFFFSFFNITYIHEILKFGSIKYTSPKILKIDPKNPKNKFGRPTHSCDRWSLPKQKTPFP